MFGAMDLGVADHRQHARREQAAQIAIALFPDTAELILTPTRVLLRHKPDPGREIPRRSENLRISDAGNQSGGGGRDSDYAIAFMDDLRDRLANRVQLTSDGHKAYLEAVEGAFGADVDYAQLVKLFGAAPESMKGRYSPAECIGARKERIEDNPDPKHVSTSYAEHQNLTMRMQMRRFTRLTNAFSKKFENHMHMVALYTVWYNYVKQHKSLKGLSPALASGISPTLWSMTDLAEMVDAAAPKLGPRGPYKKSAAEISN
jgi:hypothetical protein